MSAVGAFGGNVGFAFSVGYQFSSTFITLGVPLGHGWDVLDEWKLLAMRSAYSRVFAGTYFYLLKVENGGRMLEDWYYAFKAAMLLGLSETCIIWGAGLISGVEMAVMANTARNVAMGIGLVIINYLIFVPRQRYVPIVRKYSAEKRRLTIVAVVLHALALGLFFVPFAIFVYHMPG